MHNPFAKEKNYAKGSWTKAIRRTAYYHATDWMGMPIKPLKLRIKVTNRCNAKCVMCNVWQRQDNSVPSLPYEVTTDGYQKLCNRNREFLSELTRISFTGGEPTLRRDFVEIVRIFSEAFPRVGISVNSNGFNTRIISDYVSQVLAFHGNLSIMISLDGIGEAHDATRGVKNVFSKVQATIDGLLEMRKAHPGLKVEVNHVMTERNSDELPRVFEFCRERRVSLTPIYVIQGELYDNEQLHLQYNRSLRDKLLGYIRTLMLYDHSLLLREVCDTLEGKPRGFDCWAGRIMFILEDDGQLYPNGGCPKDFLLGNVKDFDFDLNRLLASVQAQAVIGRARKCRMCRLSCETMTTLRYPEALTGYYRAAKTDGADE